MSEPEKPRLSPFAGLSALLGIAGFIVSWFLGLAAIILALVGIVHISQSKGQFRGTGFCLFGVFIGSAATLLPFLLRGLTP